MGLLSALTLALFCCYVTSLPGIVERNGTKFALDGKPHYFVGANFWQGANLGSPLWRNHLDKELDALQGMGVTNLRVMAASEGPDDLPYRMRPSIMPSPGVYNHDVLVGLDFLLTELSARNMKAVMVLNNFWYWSGGMAQYVSWATNTSIPYPNDTGDWSRFQRYAEQFYSCEKCSEWYKAHIKAIIQRTNTISDIPYAQDAAIFSWEIANEPRNFPVSWVQDISSYIKQLDPNHMVTIGMEGHLPPAENVTDNWIEAHQVSTIDYSTVHIWVQNRGWYDPLNPKGTFGPAVDKAREQLNLHHTESLETIAKPLVFEEFGLARDNESYVPGTPVVLRDAFYAVLLKQTFQTAEQGVGGLCGVAFWAWSGSEHPPSPWIGDPPHEPAGWYSVFDTDTSTQTVIATAAELMSNLLV